MVTNKENKTQFTDIIRPFVKFKGLFILAFFSVVVTVAVLTMLSPEIYESQATLFIQNIENTPERGLQISPVYSQRYLIKNQIAVLESRNIAEDVIQRLEATSQKDSLFILGYLAPEDTSKSILGISIPDFGKNKETKKPTHAEKILAFQKSTEVAHELESDIIHVRVKSRSAEEAALIANKWIDAYRELDLTDSQNGIQKSTGHIKQKLDEVQSKLRIAENKLAYFQQENQVVSLDEKTQQMVIQLASFESQAKETKSELEGVQQQLQYLNRQLDESKKHIVEDMGKLSSPVLQNLLNQLGDLEARKAGMEAQLLGEGLPVNNNQQIKMLENRIKGIRQKITSETKDLVKNDLGRLNPLNLSESLVNDISELRAREQSLLAQHNALQGIVAQLNQKMAILPGKSIELARLQREVQVQSRLYVMIREKYEESQIQKINSQDIIRVVDRASPSLEPVHPKKAFNMILAIFFGGLLGVGVVLAKDFFQDQVQHLNDLNQFSVPVIGGVPQIRKHKSNGRITSKSQYIYRAKNIFPYLMTHINGNFAASESYRSIRTAITSLDNGNAKTRTILFTSPGPAEGKSTTVANIGIALAKRGIKTLIVDSDLRRPVLDVVFTGSRKSVGLTKYLGNGLHWRDTVRETAIKGLNILPAGTPVINASELLASKQMHNFLKEVRNEYKMILFDTPPVLPLTDASVLAGQIDGVVMVVQADKTTKAGVQRSLELIKQVGGNLLGVVMTGLKDAELYEYSSYYQPGQYSN